MNSLKTIVLAFACIIAIAVMGAVLSASSQTNTPVRNFEFTYLSRFPLCPQTPRFHGLDSAAAIG